VALLALRATVGGRGLQLLQAEAMGAALLLGAETIGLAGFAEAVLVAVGVAAGGVPGDRDNGGRKKRRRRRSSAGRGRGHRVLSTHRADGGTARRDAAA
jgi:hypothetical protein